MAKRQRCKARLQDLNNQFVCNTFVWRELGTNQDWPAHVFFEGNVYGWFNQVRESGDLVNVYRQIATQSLEFASTVPAVWPAL